MRARLDEYGFHDWTVVIRPNLSSNNTDPPTGWWNIRADSHYSIAELKRNVIHEVDTHVLRAVNGAQRPIGSSPSAPCRATCHRGRAGGPQRGADRYLNPQRTRIFAGRVVASYRAARASFARVYVELRDYRFNHNEAWTIAKRVKRGLANRLEGQLHQGSHVPLGPDPRRGVHPHRR